MGTYDNRGGSPISTEDAEPHIFPEEVQVLEILENAGVPSQINDRVVDVVRRLCEKSSNAEWIIECIKQEFISSEPEFSDKVIHGMENEWQSWKASMYFNIPLKYGVVNGRFTKTEEPSQSFEEAFDKWLNGVKDEASLD